MKQRSDFGSAIRVVLPVFCLLWSARNLWCQTPDSFNPEPNSDVYAMAVQPDGKILLGGFFTAINGQPYQRLARFYPDGTLDRAFSPNPNDEVGWVGIQADGKILVRGLFDSLGGQTRTGIGRLNTDGSLDTSFHVSGLIGAYGTALQSDGRIVIVGLFTNFSALSPTILRVNQDGALDSTFVQSSVSGEGYIAIQPGGNIVVAGAIGGQSPTNFARLNPDGTQDAGFNPGTDGYIYSLAIQSDGKILVGGSFSLLNGQSRTNLGRLNPDGSLDNSFAPQPSGACCGGQAEVDCICLQSDGKILIAGAFGTVAGQNSGNVARLNADGSLDTTFNPQVGGAVAGIGLQADGRLLICGPINSIGGQVRPNVGRVTNTYPATQNLAFDGSSLTWLRGGTSPEVWRVSFEASTNGVDWFSLGTVTRITGGWNLGALSLPSRTTFHAQGFVEGELNAANYFVEAFAGLPFISGQPKSLTNYAGSVALFTVQATGSQTLGYQWLKNGTNLTDTGNVFGSAKPMLLLSNVLNADIGGYSVVVTNSYGSVTSAVATLTVIEPFITIQPTNETRDVGQTAQLCVTVAGTLPLAYEWWKNGVPIAGATNSALTLTNVQRADADRYYAVISNAFGTVTSAVVVLTVNLASADSFNPAPDDPVYHFVYTGAVQPDQKIVVGGTFYRLAGQPVYGAGRLLSDGTLDSGFNLHGNGELIEAVAVQPDGGILVGGYFPNPFGPTYYNITRFTPNTYLDAGFSGSADFTVYCLALQPDGNIVVGGQFTSLNGVMRNHIGRFLPNGGLDDNFNPGADGYVYSLALQPDGKILVAGSFGTLGGQTSPVVGRLNSDGTLDTSFNPPALAANSYIEAIAVQPDGKILVGGYFCTLSNIARCNLARLNSDGTLDPMFDCSAGGAVFSLALQTDGKVIVGGFFTTLGSLPRHSIGRLNPDGTPDYTFDPGVDGPIAITAPGVYSLSIQPDGKILAGGYFYILAGQSRTNFGRLNNTEPAIEKLSFDSSNITWLRGGTSPEVWRTTFDAWSNQPPGWLPLSTGTRVAGGWQVTGLALSSNSTIRARGLVAGSGSGSGWFVESFAGYPAITNQPVSRTNNAATVATFNVQAIGSPTLNFHWQKNGTNLLDNGLVSGASTATLTVSNVLGGDAGFYSVVVANAYGSVTSMLATLTVIDPLIFTQPTNAAVNVGTNASFSVGVIGTVPLAFQWRHGGTNLGGATGSSLALTNVQTGDGGNYDAIVTNSFGAVTSTVALLTVNLAVADDFNPGPNAGVLCAAVQTDGKILFSGGFSYVKGQIRIGLARVNLDGSLDTNFSPQPNAVGSVFALALQPDGKILVGGSFTQMNGAYANHIARLNTNGTTDFSFMGTANGPVSCIALQQDGKVLVGGSFTTLDNQSRGNLGRLNVNGTLDTGFYPNVNNAVYCIAPQPDGRLLIGGNFTQIDSQFSYFLSRLNPDGTVDTALNPGPNNAVYCLALQSDGKVVIGGTFSSLGGQYRSNIGRLNPDLRVDPGFNPGANGYVYSLGLQTDGKIIAGGSFGTLASQARSGIGRLNTDGTADFIFNPGANGTVRSLALQTDGKLVVGGYFSSLAGSLRSEIGRLTNTGPATQTFTYQNSSLSWLRGGTGPEVWGATFEASPDNTNWSSLGAGTRLPGGWGLQGIFIPPGSAIRAHGFIDMGGFQGGAAWLAESDLQLPTFSIITSDPSFGLNRGQFGFKVRSPSGQVAIVEATTDFTSWVPVQTNVVDTSGIFFFTDTESALFPHRFYRARLYFGPLPPPSIVPNDLGFQSGQFSFNLTAIAGQTVIIEASTNLSVWTALSTNTFGSGPLYFRDSSSTNFAWRFYRSRVQ